MQGHPRVALFVGLSMAMPALDSKGLLALPYRAQDHIRCGRLTGRMMSGLSFKPSGMPHGRRPSSICRCGVCPDVFSVFGHVISMFSGLAIFG
jgi:hypothetical protein